MLLYLTFILVNRSDAFLIRDMEKFIRAKLMELPRSLVKSEMEPGFSLCTSDF